MGQKYDKLSNKLTNFIKKQQMFFVATADIDGRVNVSPKGLDCFRVITDTQVVWLNLTGSGNESAAHVQRFPRMTLMFAAFDGNPMILRLYGKAKVIHKNNQEWDELYGLFDDYIGARQIFIMDIDLLQTSCGMAVPLYDYKQQRDQLINSFNRRGIEGTDKYWAEKNTHSIDGKSTQIIKNNLT